MKLATLQRVAARRFFLPTALALLVLCNRGECYGPQGHRMVGAIADRLLADKPVATKISDLIDGISLADAAQLPDDIKTWDKHPNAELQRLAGHPEIRDQLHAFVDANPNHGATADHPSHHQFHFVDVPVKGNSRYADGTTGRSQWDIVHMINFCIRVVKGQESENNARKITRPVAVILLAHYLGDVHQPLHVGAEYFNSDGKPVNPDAGEQGFHDIGGNNLDLVFSPSSTDGHNHAVTNLHSYWDDSTVEKAGQLWNDAILAEQPSLTGHITPQVQADFLARHEPPHWKMDPQLTVEKWSEAWADEILPIAKEAHRRLDFQDIQIDHSAAAGTAVANGQTYPAWSGKVVKNEIPKAGWRLAALLEQIIAQ